MASVRDLFHANIFNNVTTESGEISREDLNELGVKTW